MSFKQCSEWKIVLSAKHRRGSLYMVAIHSTNTQASRVLLNLLICKIDDGYLRNNKSNQ